MKSITVKCQQCGTKNKIPVFKQHLQPKCGRCGSPISLDNSIKPVQLTDGDFIAFVQQAPLPVLVDFYSPTCGPCHMLAPIIDKITMRFSRKLLVAKVDTSTNPQSAMRHQIKGVPTLIFFKKGQPVDQITGAVPERQLIEKIQSILQ